MSSESVSVTPKRSILLLSSLIANGVLFVAAAALLALYLQSNSDLVSAKVDAAKEAAHVAELRAELYSARADAQTLAQKSSKLESVIEEKDKELFSEKAKAEAAQIALDKEKSRLPPVPVRVQTRQSALGKGLVGIFENYSAKQLPVVLAFQNPTTGQMKKFSTQIAPGAKLQIGHLDGWQFASGDQVVIISAGFATVRVVIQ